MKRVMVYTRYYRVDSEGLLLNCDEWDQSFVRAMALGVGISDDLTEKQWGLINSRVAGTERIAKSPPSMKPAHPTIWNGTNANPCFPTNIAGERSRKPD